MSAIKLKELPNLLNARFLKSRGYSYLLVEIDRKIGLLCYRRVFLPMVNRIQGVKVLNGYIESIEKYSVMEQQKMLMMGKPLRSNHIVNRVVSIRILDMEKLNENISYPCWEIIGM